MASLSLLPILSTLFWMFYLHVNNIPLKQGAKGFIYIIVTSGVLIVILSILLLLTAGQHIALP